MPTFDIIITVFNRLEYTKRTIASLIESGAFRDCQRLIIVDNHSLEEGMEDFLRDMSHYQKTFVIRRPANDGWATAVNDALGLSRAEFILISNNDVTYQLGFHRDMFESFAHIRKLGLLGVWRHTSHSFLDSGIQDEWLREMTDIPAVGWMIPKEVMEQVGMITEKGACLTKGGNGEDSDYINRVRGAGFLVGVPARDLATHIDGY